jgi:hypothetical protein
MGTVGKAAAQCIPLLTYSRRSIRPDSLEEFKVKYDVFAKATFASTPGVKALFAFPEPGDELAYWHVCWSRDVESFVDDSTIANLYESKAEDPDTVEVYGGWNEATVEAAKGMPSLRHNFHKSLAGYMKADGAGQSGPAMFGFTKRRVKPGMLDSLAASFPRVCELWYEKGGGGILCATVSRDPMDPDVVHDLRIMANKEAYMAHADKTDEELTAAIKTWFANYDEQYPITGELYAASPNDKEFHSSSIVKVEKRPEMVTFHWGDAGMLGTMPDMTKGDDG